MKVSGKLNDTDLRYRASNMITIPYIMLVGAHFKSEVGFEGRIWDLIVSVPDHCLAFYFG